MKKENFITTGCIFYPIPFTCFDNKKIIWANPIENVEERFDESDTKFVEFKRNAQKEVSYLVKEAPRHNYLLR